MENEIGQRNFDIGKMNQPFLQILETWSNKRNKKTRYKFPDLGKHHKWKIYGRLHQ